MEAIEYARLLIPIVMLATFELISHHKKRMESMYSGMNQLHCAYFLQGIAWCVILAASFLLSQIIIDPLATFTLSLFFAALTTLTVVITAQQLSVRVFFDDKTLVVTQLLGESRYCQFDDIVSVHEKQMANGGGRVFDLVLSDGKIRLVVSMLTGHALHKLIEHLRQLSRDIKG
ncbi:hypothetical protein [Vibrio ouci]|uniref:DUF304 domain-containing protein n=1 Tax=Vibrio ouci TaxID=2499078 RepID=A0A4Y8WD61_9VIBR|nr:hypothetical protein [Vibrio ouci]TFH90298.1 hypothetical protein ELS82_17830 [Vibrio ouci]